MKGNTPRKNVAKSHDSHKPHPHAKTQSHATGAPLNRVTLPEVDVFTDSEASPEVQELTRDLRDVHDAQAADDNFQ